MRKLTKLFSALIVLVLATAFIGCSNPSLSDNGGGNSNSPTYTTVAGGTYIDSSTNTGFIFYDNYSVSQRTNHDVEIPMERAKWRIVNGNTVEIYNESTRDVTNTFTANSDFSSLTHTSHDSAVFTRR